jgi:hypothetical protein
MEKRGAWFVLFLRITAGLTLAGGLGLGLLAAMGAAFVVMASYFVGALVGFAFWWGCALAADALFSVEASVGSLDEGLAALLEQTDKKLDVITEALEVPAAKALRRR